MIDFDHMAAQPIGALPAYAKFQSRPDKARPISSYHKASTVALFLQRRTLFGAKETQHARIKEFSSGGVQVSPTKKL